MALFNVPTRKGRESDSIIAKKSKSNPKKSTTTVKGGGDLFGRISMIRALVEKNLGNLKDRLLVITDEKELHDYIDVAIKNDIISIDTETTGLNPMADSIVGICIYTPNKKSAYIPLAHKSFVTGQLVSNQLSLDVVKKEFERIRMYCERIVMFNADFDIRFIKHNLGVKLNCWWDCFLAARLLNENEESNTLKILHNKYVKEGSGEAFKFDDLFKGIPFDMIPIEVAYLYAANDPLITYELYQFQEYYLRYDSDRDDMRKLAWVFHNIEMPCVDVIVEMEDTGVAIDFDTAKNLYNKYTEKREILLDELYRILDEYENEIISYKLSHANSKLSDPINLSSPSQIAIILYDIIKLKMVYDKKKKQETRGTGEDILLQLDHPFCKKLLEYRGIEKLLSTYIEKIPNCVDKKDKRVHCRFNQYGADTGRMSSSDPNLQNIPSHNKDIRKMFVASDGYCLMSSDFSQQEPKCLAALCRMDGDSQMYDTFMQGKDLYSEIASKAFNVPYEDCKEFRDDGTTNKDGKARRTQAKSILLGVLYGRGTESIAEQLGISTREAQDIKDSVFRGFPAIKKFEEDSIKMVESLGYVTTVCGRKRRLPSMTLPDYEVIWSKDGQMDLDPMNFAESNFDDEVPIEIQQKWIRKIKQTPFKYKRRVFEQANEEGIWIVDNTKKKDTTKVVNARIQGSAADLTKLAMIELHTNKRLRELGFRILIPVHDEIIAECPMENAKECSELLAQTMSKAAEKILEMPIKCDVEITKEWYGETLRFSED